MKSEFWRHPARHVTNAIHRSHSSRVLASSALFDADWYLTQYPDGAIKGMSPARHYLLYGAAEGRNPSPRFDGNWYLKQNPDVVRLGMNPLLHYALHGRKQGREIRPSAQADFQRAITGEKTGSVEGQLEESNNVRPTQMSTRRTIIYTPFFTAPSNERQSEINFCVRMNVDNEHVDTVILLVDDDSNPEINSQKIEIVKLDQRPTYRLWLELAGKQDSNNLAVLCNSDIYFDQSIELLTTLVSAEPPVFVALSRYDKVEGKFQLHPDPHWSQDSWAINTSADIPASLLRQLDFPLGVPRCDNKTAYGFAVHGWKIVNPCRHVRSVHVHKTNLRTYDKKLDHTILGAVGYVHPGTDLNSPAEISIDIWALGAAAIKDVSVNPSLDRWLREHASTSTDARLPAEAASAPNEKKIGIGRVNSIETKIKPHSWLWKADVQRFVSEGKIAYEHRHRFRAYKLNDEVLCLDSLSPRTLRQFETSDLTEILATGPLQKNLIAAFIPPVVDVYPINIDDHLRSQGDCQYWQYPCSTEKQAYENHLGIEFGKNIDRDNNIIHTYVGLPWATYVDKNTFPSEIYSILPIRIKGLKSLAEESGYTLATHTVSQHIHWERHVEHFDIIGITDLHISQYEKSVEPPNSNFPFHIHSWPLIAVNYVDQTRSRDLVRGKPIDEKKYLASMIGAHMQHYRSDIRIRILEAAQKDGGNDILIDLGDEWHFNKIEFDEQVQGKIISEAYTDAHDAATFRYNNVMSNSIFSLCPEGAGPNTVRLWESLAVGSIPVILSDDWVEPRIGGANVNLRDCCVFYPQNEPEGLFTDLRNIGESELETMQNRCIECYGEIRKMRTF